MPGLSWFCEMAHYYKIKYAFWLYIYTFTFMGRYFADFCVGGLKSDVTDFGITPWEESKKPWLLPIRQIAVGAAQREALIHGPPRGPCSLHNSLVYRGLAPKNSPAVVAVSS
jgi:hypothetical protein